MVNEIKLDKAALLPSQAKPQQKNQTADKPNSGGKDVIVTSQLSNLLMADNQIDTDDHARVTDIKSKIHSGQYQINSDRLAESIYHNLFLSEVS